MKPVQARATVSPTPKPPRLRALMLIAAVAAVAAVFAIPSSSAVACSPATCPHLEVVEGTHILQWGPSGYEHWYWSENGGVGHDVPQALTPGYERWQLEKGEPPYRFEPPPPFLSGLVPQTVYYQVWVANRPQDKSNAVPMFWP